MKTARIIKDGEYQAVQLPEEYRFSEDEVIISRIGDTILLMPKTQNRDAFMAAADMFSPDFMENGRTPQPNQDREKI